MRVSEPSTVETERGLHRRLSSWEATAHRLLHRSRLDRLRLKILVFALVATLVPTLTMSYHSYSMNREHVNARIGEELRNASTQTAREFNLWLKERFYETRVFSSSYEVTENLERLARPPGAGRPPGDAVRRLTAYLASVRAKFPDYGDLAVVDLDGRRLVPVQGPSVKPRLPGEWVTQIERDDNVIGEASRTAGRDTPTAVIAVPIRAASGRLLGAMAGTLRLDAPSPKRLAALQSELRAESQPTAKSLAEVLTADPRSFLTSHSTSAELSQRNYLYSWGLAHYLAVRQPILEIARLDRYVDPQNAKHDPLVRFEQFVGMPLPEFAPLWRKEMLTMKAPEK